MTPTRCIYCSKELRDRSQDYCPTCHTADFIKQQTAIELRRRGQPAADDEHEHHVRSDPARHKGRRGKRRRMYPDRTR